MYPLLLKAPIKDYLWGGTRLKDEFFLESEKEIAAEGWMLSCHKDGAGIVVNGELCSIPSTHIKPGDVIGVRERSKSLEVIQNSVAASANKYSWLEWDSNSFSGKFLNVPERTEIPEPINEQLIVELYSK